MLIGQTFRITTSSGTDITPTNNTLQLNAYESRTIALSSDALSEGIIFESDGYSAALDATMECGTPISTRSSQPSGRSPLGGSNSLPAWDSAPTCGFSCPPFRLYHTDETGDWEIFRLDGANKSTRESIRENLSICHPASHPIISGSFSAATAMATGKFTSHPLLAIRPASSE
jgi:hypothetical protein